MGREEEEGKGKREEGKGSGIVVGYLDLLFRTQLLIPELLAVFSTESL